MLLATSLLLAPMAAWTSQAPVTTGALVQAPDPVLFDAPWIGYDIARYPDGLSWASRTADFNGDGAPDLAAVGYDYNPSLSILLGDGAGGYLPPAQYALVLGAWDLEAADFDNDGDVDVVAADTGRFWEGFTFELFRNNGDGSFSYGGWFNCGAGPNGMTAADFNGDGWMDVAVAHDAYIVCAASFAVVLNDQNGGFLAPRTYTIGSCSNDIDAGDLDGDGDPDLVVGHEGNRASILRNDNGAFSVQEVKDALPGAFIGVSPAVQMADVDHDGDNDVLYTHEGAGGVSVGAVALFRNNGAAGFGAAQRITLGPGNGGVHVATADVTGDGWIDLLVPTEITQKWWLVPGDGAGGFGAARELRAGEFPRSIEATDLDGDADLDVTVVASGSLEACVYLNPGDGAFEQRPVIEMSDPREAPTSFSNLGSADIDLDGDLDLVVGFSHNFNDRYGLTVRRNNGDGSFASGETYNTSRLPDALTLSDVSGDGYVDLVFADYLQFSSNLRVRLNDGTGAFGAGMTFGAVGCDPEAIETADVDEDGDLDVLVGGCYGVVQISKNNGDGTGFSAFLRHTVNGNTHALGLGDFNEDGHLDLLTPSGQQGALEISFGNGDGSFDAPLPVATGRDVHAVAVTHLDADGHLDLAAIYNLDGTGLTARRGRGNGDFFLANSYMGSQSSRFDQVRSVATSDVNADGFSDVMTANFGSQDICVWLGRGDGTFEEVIRYGVGQQAWDLHHGDYDGDGLGDVAVLVERDSPFTSWYYPGVVVLRGLVGGLPNDLALSQGELRRGQPAVFTVSHALPGETVYFLYSRNDTGAGPCPPQLGGLCLNLLRPITGLGSAQTDAGGTAALVLTVPAGAPAGQDVHTQAVARRGPGGAGSVKSNTVSTSILP
ncbi:MAG: VCBS repeat-containing protein [Planctomycetota bacterium]|nr:MAG: VCBS repeat-containing protein [Planctomycetota bacterium]